MVRDRSASGSISRVGSSYFFDDGKPPQDADTRQRTPRVLFTVLWLCYASLYLTRKPTAIAKPALVRLELLSQAQLGHIDTVFLTTYATAQWFTAPVLQRLGPRDTLAGALLLAAAASIGFSTASTFPTFLIFAFVHGSAQSCCFSLCVSMLSPKRPALQTRTSHHAYMPSPTDRIFVWIPAAERGKVLGWWTTCQQVGGIAGATLTSWMMAQAPDDWQRLFWVPAIVTAICGLACRAVLPVADESTESSKETRQSSSVLSVIKSYPRLAYLGGAYFCIKLVRYFLLMWLPLYLHNHLGLSPSQAGVASSVFDLGATAGGVLFGIAADHPQLGSGAHRLPVALALCVTCAVSTGLYGTLSGSASGGPLWVHVGVMGVLGLLIAGPETALGGVITQDAVLKDQQDPGSVPPGDLAAAASFTNGVGSLGPIVQGMAAGWILQHSWGTIFLLLGATLLLASAALAFAQLTPHSGLIPHMDHHRFAELCQKVRDQTKRQLSEVSVTNQHGTVEHTKKKDE